jgi:hypothetical protein
MPEAGALVVPHPGRNVLQLLNANQNVSPKDFTARKSFLRETLIKLSLSTEVLG